MKKLLALALVVALCLGSVSMAVAEEKILLGCLQDVTGPTSSLGNMVYQGALWAMEEINAAGGIGGKMVELKIYDTTGSVDEAIKGYTKACDVDKVSAIIGPPVGNIALAIAPMSEQYDVPIISFAVDPKTIIGESGLYKNMFLMQPNSNQLAATMASYAVKEMGLKTFAILCNEQNSYATALRDGFIEAVKPLGGEIVANEGYNADNKDFNTLLTKVMMYQPDAIYANNYTADLVLTVQAAEAVGYEGWIICGLDGCPPFNNIVEGVDDLSKVMFINNVDDTAPEMVAMIADIKSKIGVDATNKFFMGYDAMNILGGIIGQVGTDSVAIREKIAQVSGYEGLTGSITINPETHMTDGLEMCIFVYEGKTPVMQKRYAAE
ncbi:MAG: ABC transporter substrate-binding protein [Clostridia bacterium]